MSENQAAAATTATAKAVAEETVFNTKINERERKNEGILFLRIKESNFELAFDIFAF